MTHRLKGVDYCKLVATAVRAKYHFLQTATQKSVSSGAVRRTGRQRYAGYSVIFSQEQLY